MMARRHLHAPRPANSFTVFALFVLFLFLSLSLSVALASRIVAILLIFLMMLCIHLLLLFIEVNSDKHPPSRIITLLVISIINLVIVGAYQNSPKHIYMYYMHLCTNLNLT
jgi:amino acid transporter